MIEATAALKNDGIETGLNMGGMLMEIIQESAAIIQGNHARIESDASPVHASLFRERLMNALNKDEFWTDEDVTVIGTDGSLS